MCENQSKNMKIKNFILNFITILIVAEACSKTNQIRRTENQFKFRPLHKKNGNSKILNIRPTGFDRGLQCEKILGQCDETNEKIVKMKWKNSNFLDCVPIEKAKLTCPLIVIQYLEDIVLDHFKKELEERKIELDLYKSKLDQSNTKLDQSNNELDQPNTELDQSNKKLDQPNTALVQSNTKLDLYKSKLDKSNTELDRFKSKLGQVYTELDQFKSKLDQSNTKLVICNFKLDQCIKSKFYYDIPVGLIPAGG